MRALEQDSMTDEAEESLTETRKREGDATESVRFA